ncbi:PREDICTED: protein Hook homolog 3-like, partial [Apaloderma vittatum]|uniref:protein Hook homolog 3-like n=1 Tax=Apaloderma vittatum TaxID=57397 RepID=UPI0005212903
ILGQQINDFTLPDVNLIGEHADAAELGRMLQLILGCAVNCEQKQEYIQTIMMMEESVQHVVMTAIQELMSKESPVSVGNDAYVDLDRQLKKTTEELNEALATKEEIAQRCHELDMQVAALQEEKSSLLAENQILMERLNQSDSIEDPNSPAGRRHLQLQTQLEQLQEETFRLEAAKDDYRIRCEELEKEIAELRQQTEELTTLAEEAQSLKDEIDVLRHSSDKVAKLESQVESYKKKLEDLGDLRRQVKLLEEKNTMYMQNTVSLEEELRKANAARGQLETYKRQAVELQNRLSEESKKADKLDYECKRLREKVDSLQKEKDRLRTERDSLKETIEELRCVQAQEGQLTTTGLMPLGRQEPSDSLAAEIITPEINTIAFSVEVRSGSACSNKNMKVVDALETTEAPENTGTGTFCPKKVAGLIAQLKCLYINACSMSSQQEEPEATVKQENNDVDAITEIRWDDLHDCSGAMDDCKPFRRDGQGDVG